MIRRDEALIKYLRDELPGRINEALSGDGASIIRGLSRLCIEALNRSCGALGVDCGGDELVSAWRVMERVVELSGEFVLARYMAIATSSSLIASVASPAIADMLGRDLLTCVEKVRVMILRMVEEGRPWREIYGLGD